jgi:hypothetical protein
MSTCEARLQAPREQLKADRLDGFEGPVVVGAYGH